MADRDFRIGNQSSKATPKETPIERALHHLEVSLTSTDKMARILELLTDTLARGESVDPDDIATARAVLPVVRSGYTHGLSVIADIRSQVKS